MKTIAFFGHRRLRCGDISDRVKKVMENYLDQEIHCLIGTHGEFDNLVLSVCRELRNSFPNIRITLIFTTLTVFNKKADEVCAIAELYKDVETMIYEIEQEHFKNRIVESNKRMVDESDVVICYVDMELTRSGARRAIKHAMKQEKEVINLFKEEDRPFYGLSEKEIMYQWQKFIKN